jgi:hypothetical protein
LGDPGPFRKPTDALLVKDRLGRVVVLFGGQREKNYAREWNPDHEI